jgi:hypothetical protein
MSARRRDLDEGTASSAGAWMNKDIHNRNVSIECFYKVRAPDAGLASGSDDAQFFSRFTGPIGAA